VGRIDEPEILLAVLIEATDGVVLILKETMEGAGKTFLKTVPVEADVVAVGSWAEKCQMFLITSSWH